MSELTDERVVFGGAQRLRLRLRLLFELFVARPLRFVQPKVVRLLVVHLPMRAQVRRLHRTQKVLAPVNRTTPPPHHHITSHHITSRHIHTSHETHHFRASRGSPPGDRRYFSTTA
jgi:hypothetical protein